MHRLLHCDLSGMGCKVLGFYKSSPQCVICGVYSHGDCKSQRLELLPDSKLVATGFVSFLEARGTQASAGSIPASHQPNASPVARTAHYNQPPHTPLRISNSRRAAFTPHSSRVGRFLPLTCISSLKTCSSPQKPFFSVRSCYDYLIESK